MNISNKEDLSGLEQQVFQMLNRQKVCWDLAQNNYKGLDTVKEKEFDFGTFTIRVQFNPSRINSSAAKVDPKSIQERPCFLCSHHLPKEQEAIPVGQFYQILVNPFPIFRKHLTIPMIEHQPQRIAGRMGDMLQLAKALPSFTLFYNGPKCGASAPDHMHFQAGSKGFMPLESDFPRMKETCAEEIFVQKDFRMYGMKEGFRRGLAMESGQADLLIRCFENLYSLLDSGKEEEPMLNVLVSFENGIWKLWVFPRKLHRPTQFFEEGKKKILISPASVDFGGVLITPREEDFGKMNHQVIEDIFNQVGIDSGDIERLMKALRQKLIGFKTNK